MLNIVTLKTRLKYNTIIQEIMKLHVVFFLCITYFLFTYANTITAEKLPKNIEWETNATFPSYVDPNAKKGGIYKTYLTSYPNTFRLFGPYSNQSFNIYNYAYSIFSLTKMDPNTLQYIPELATHWAIMPDQKTIYYKLDPDATWSDGKPITADDYIFAFEFLQSPHIKDPFQNQNIRNNYEIVQKVSPHIIKIVTKKKSWRLLYKTNLAPLPKHAITLDKNWVKKYQWKSNITASPYVLKKWKKGKYIEFHRIKNWWGENKNQFRHQYNFDIIRLNIVRNSDVAFELFKKGKLDVSKTSSEQWNKKTNIPEIEKGYIHKQKIYIQAPDGLSGIFFNVKDSVWSDINLRKAFAHTLDFETMNQKLMYSMYTRKHHFFDVYPPYKNPKQKTYPFDLKYANKLLEQSGWKRTQTSRGYREKQGNILTLKILISKNAAVAYNKHLAFIKETSKKAGINIEIKQVDGSAFITAINQHTYTSVLLAYTASRYPVPRQYLHSDNLQKNTNNLFQFSSKKIDTWIDIYEFNMDENKRIDAIFNIEKAAHEQVLLVHFWKTDYEKLLWWRYIKGPKSFVTKTGFNINVLWFDKNEYNKLKKHKKQNKSLNQITEEIDPFKVKE